MLCRRPSSSSIRDRREAATTALRRRVSMFARLARTLDPARGSSSACAPSLSSSSSIGNRGRDLRRRSVTMGIRVLSVPLSSGGPPTTPVSPRHGIGFAHLSVRQIGQIRGLGAWDTRVELWFGIVDALAYTPFTACRQRLGVRDWEGYRWRTRVARCREVRWCWCSAGCRLMAGGSNCK
jgi:hypothetical protein